MLLLKHGYAPSATVEQARTPSSSSISSPSYQDKFTVANAKKISELDSTRDLYEMREHLRAKVAIAVDKLTTVRGELEKSADRLMASRSTDAYDASMSYSPSSSSSSSSSSAKTELRTLVLDLSRQLEVAEAEYVAVNKDYESIELQLTDMINKIREESVVVSSSSSSSSKPTPVYQMSDFDSMSKDIHPIARIDVGNVPVMTGQALQFTVEEVLMGKISLILELLPILTSLDASSNDINESIRAR